MDPLPLGRCSDKNSSETKLQCSRWANLICLHCNQGVCLEHHKIHQHEIQIRAHKLNNQINDVRQILHTLTSEQLIDIFQEKIDQWSEKVINEIDLKHKKMSSQLINIIKQINIDQFRSIQLNNIDEYIGQPLTELLRIPNTIEIKHIESLEEQFEQIQEMKSFIQITNDGQLEINQPTNLLNNVFSLSLIWKYSINDCPSAMAGSPLSHNYLLIFQSKPQFSLIFIEDNKYINKIPIDYFVYDICWSQSTENFLIATQYYLYEFYPLNKRLSKSYENSRTSQILWSLACNSTDLYIIHKPDMFMYERNLRKPFEKKREWCKNDIMYEKDDQFINSIRIDHQKQIMGLSIQQINNQWRIDLFSIDNMQRLYCGTSFGISNEIDHNYCMLTPLLNNYNQWLVQYSTNDKYQTLLLNEKGQIVNKANYNGYNITLIDRDKIAFLDNIDIVIYQR